MLLGEDPPGQSLFGITGKHRDHCLENDGARVHALVGEVHSGARHPDAVLERLALGVKSGEGGQQRGMDIERATPEMLGIGRRQDPHIARVAHELYLSLVERRDEGLLVGLPGRVLRRVEEERLDAVRAGDVQDWSRAAVRDQHRHDHRKPARFGGLDEGLEVRAPS